jgi:phage capsid family|nr:MAG TPA: major capsid protein [Caudoviricetes sp.]
MAKTLREQHAELAAKVKGLEADLQNEYSSERLEEYRKGAERLKELYNAVQAVEETKGLVDSLAANTEEPAAPANGAVDESVKGLSMADRFVKSENYRRFAKSRVGSSGAPVTIDPVKVGSLEEFMVERKSSNVLATPVARLQPARYPTVDAIDRAPLTLLDVIARGKMATPAFEYVQITGVSRNAAIVPEATTTNNAANLKPISDFTTNMAECKAVTMADGFIASTQMLEDAGAFATWMQGELTYNLNALIEDNVLNGPGGSGKLTGILATTGLQNLTYTATAGTDGAIDLVKAARQAVTKLENVGTTIKCVLINPEDDELLDLAQDADKRFYSAGPFGRGPNTLWALPRIKSAKVPRGTQIIGDFNQVQLLDYKGINVNAFSQHADFAQRNLVYVRAECRAGLAIYRPNRLCVVKKS